MTDHTTGQREPSAPSRGSVANHDAVPAAIAPADRLVRLGAADRKSVGTDKVPLNRDCGTGNTNEDTVNHPPHYNWHPNGIEAVDVCEAFSYNLGNAIKYIFRSGGTVTKGDVETDLEKAAWYIRREIERLRKSHGRQRPEGAGSDS